MNKETSYSATSAANRSCRASSALLIAAAFVCPIALPFAMMAVSSADEKYKKSREDAKDRFSDEEEKVDGLARHWDDTRADSETRLDVNLHSSDGSGFSSTYRADDED